MGKKARGLFGKVLALFTAAALTITAHAVPAADTLAALLPEEAAIGDNAGGISLFKNNGTTGGYTAVSDTQELYIGETLSIIAFVDTGASPETIVITTSNSNVSSSESTVQTNSEGCILTVLTAKTKGETVVTFTPASDQSKKKSVTVKVVDPTDIKSVKLVEGTMKKSYFVGDELSWGTAHLVATKYNGTTEDIAIAGNDDVTVTADVTASAGTKTVTLTYEGSSVTVNVTVTAVSLTKIAVISQPTKTAYYIGEALDLDGCVLTAYYNNDAEEDIDLDDPGLKVSGFSSAAAGVTTVKFTYGGKEASLLLTVVAKTVTSVILTDVPAKTNYFTGESIDLTEGVLQVTYNLGDTEDIALTKNGAIASGVSVTGFNNIVPGIYVVKVWYGGKSDSFTVEVSALTVTKLEWTKEPTKTQYYVGDSLDLTGGVLKATYNDGSIKTISLPSADVTVSGFDGTQAGEQTIYINYGGKSADYDVNVAALTLDSLTIVSEPAKKLYFVGETAIDLTGGMLKASYNNGTSEFVAMTDAGVTVSGFTTAAVIDPLPITITYKNASVTFNIAVKILALDSIEVYQLPSKTQYKLGEALDLTGGTLKAYYNNDTVAIVPMTQAGVTVTGFDSVTEGVKPLTVTFTGKTTYFSVTVVTANITGITISKLPKTSYVIGDALDVTGGEITVSYDNGTKQTIAMTAGMVSGFSSDTKGQKTLMVTYGGKTASYNITVGEVTVLSIEMYSLPRTLYYQGEELDVTGGMIKVNYTDGTSELTALTADMVSGFSTSITGKKTLNVTYSGRNTTYQIEVKADALTALYIQTLPAKVDYAFGEALDLTGGKLTAVFVSGIEQTVDMTDQAVTVSGFDPSGEGAMLITLTYLGKSASFGITVGEKAVSGISVFRDPDKINYYFGESLDLTGGILMVVYEDGTAKQLPLTDAGITVTGFDTASEGVNYLTVTYSELTTELMVTVYEKKAVSLKVALDPAKMTYSLNEALDLTGGVVAATYIYNDTENIPMTDARVSVSAFDSSTAGTKEITLTVDEKSVSLTVLVTSEIISALSVYTPPTKTYYYVNEKCDLSGGKLKAVYNGGAAVKYIDMTDPLVYVTGFDSSTAGMKTLTFSYGGKSATFTITVANDTVTTLTVADLPKRTYYSVGETLDLTGGTLRVEYNNGTRTEYIPMTAAGVKVSGFSSERSGVKRITLTYSGLSAYFDVTIRPIDKVVLKDEGFDTLYEALEVIAAEVAGRRADVSYTVEVTEDLYETKTPVFANVPINIVSDSNVEITVKTSALSSRSSIGLTNVKFLTTKDKNVSFNVKGDFTGEKTDTGNITAAGSVMLEDAFVNGKISAGGKLTLDGVEVKQGVSAKGTMTCIDSEIGRTAVISGTSGTTEISRSKIGGKLTCASELIVKNYSELGTVAAKRTLYMTDSKAGAVTVSGSSGLTVFDDCETGKLSVSTQLSMTNTVVDGSITASQILSVSGKVYAMGAVSVGGIASLADGSVLSYTSLSVNKSGISGSKTLILRVSDKHGSAIALSPTSRTYNVLAKKFKGSFISSLLSCSAENYKSPTVITLKGTKLIIT